MRCAGRRCFSLSERSSSGALCRRAACPAARAGRTSLLPGCGAPAPAWAGQGCAASLPVETRYFRAICPRISRVPVSRLRRISAPFTCGEYRALYLAAGAAFQKNETRLMEICLPPSRGAAHGESGARFGGRGPAWPAAFRFQPGEALCVFRGGRHIPCRLRSRTARAALRKAAL